MGATSSPSTTPKSTSSSSENRAMRNANSSILRRPPRRLPGCAPQPITAGRRRSAERGLALLQQTEGHRVLERLPRRIDDVLVDADRVVLVDAVARLDQHARDGAGALLALDDAHLEVDELELGQARVEPADRGAQREVEPVDRAVAL